MAVVHTISRDLVNSEKPHRLQFELAFFAMIRRDGIVKSVDWVECSYQSPYGRIESNWKVEGGALTWKICVPVNSIAAIYLPCTDESGIREGGKPLADTAGVTRLRAENGSAVLSLESGLYTFVAPYSSRIGP